MESYKNEKELHYDEDYASFVNSEFRTRQTNRISYELQWRLNTEFIKGNQYLNINPALRKIEEVPKLYWYQEKEVFNQLATIVETRISRLSRQKPVMKARPATQEDQDLQAAKISTMLLQMKWFDENLSRKYSDIIMWLEHCGTAFVKSTWNSNKGRYLGSMVEVEEKEIEDGILIEEEQEIDVYEGDIDVTVVSPYEIYPDSNSRNSLEECKSIIHARAFHINDIYDMYGVEVEEEQVDSFALQAGTGLSGISYNAGSYKTKNEPLKNHAIVKEYYERPTKKHPEGRFIVVAGDKTLYSGSLPYKVGDNNKVDFPFVRIPAIEMPNQFWGVSVAERCIPIQRRYNALRNRKAEYLNLVAIGQWYEPVGSLDEDAELNNAPANRIRFHAGAGRPEPVQFPSLPSSFENEEATLLSEFTAISGVSELSRFSEAPSGVKSGIALSIANEQDDTRISMTANQIADGMVQLGKHWLRLFKQFVNETRMVRSLSKDVNVKYWNASTLNSEDIIIENSSALAETPAQRRQMVFDLMSTGIFNREENNPFSREAVNKILELIEIGHWETGVEDELRQHENRATRENHNMEMGQMLSPKDFDDHEAHIKQHNLYRMRPEYDELMASPQGQMIEQLFEQHIAMHKQMLMQEQYQVMMEQMQLAGMQQGMMPGQQPEQQSEQQPIQ